MIITFNELRRIKDKLPSGSSQRIADELGIDVDTVRNYFGGKHFDAKEGVMCNSGFLTGKTVKEAIPAAIDEVVKLKENEFISKVCEKCKLPFYLLSLL